MPNTPAKRPTYAKATVGRPDVEAIAARRTSEQLCAECGARLSIVCTDIPALIEYIEALEARQESLEAVVKAAEVLRVDGSWGRLLEANMPGNNLLSALAALGDGDG